ncbi:MAG: serine hydrolase [Gemmatimonadaceae bacterium]
MLPSPMRPTRSTSRSNAITRRGAAALGTIPLALALGSAPSAAQSPGRKPAPVSFPAELDVYLAKAVRDWDVPGLAIAVVRNDTVLIARGYGVRELGKPDRVDENTVFNIASLTKSFTSAAAALLVDEGKLRWDQPVREILPWAELPDPYVTRQTTMRDLLSHRVGLFAANMMWVPTDIDRREVLRRIRFLPAEQPFRGGMAYSNVLYTLAGEATAAAAGSTWEELIRTRLVVPLGMRSTTVSFAALAGQPDVAQPHAVVGGKQRPIPYRDYTNTAPSASVNSTAADMARWLRFQLNDGVLDGKRLVSERAMQETHSPQIIIATTPAMRAARGVDFFAGYGLGWQVMDYHGNPMLWHSGNADGMPSYMAILPAKKLGVVVMLNSWIAPFLHGALAARVLDHYLGVATKDYSGEALAAQRAANARAEEAWRRLDSARVRNSVPSRPLAAYAGTFADSLYGEITVALEGDRLSMRMGRGQAAELEHWSYDTFAVRWRDAVFAEYYPARVTFSLNAAGEPDALSMQLNRDAIRAGRVRSPR